MPVYHTEVPSPLGTLYVAATEAGVCALNFPGERDEHLARLARLFPGEPVVEAPTPVLAQAAEALDRYFAGRREPFTVPLDLRGTPFRQRVWVAMRAIPFGRTVTYGELATQAGGSPRAVGQACGANPVCIFVP